MYSKYLFTGGGIEVDTAVKIEIGKDGKPKYLHVKDLRPSEANSTVDKIVLALFVAHSRGIPPIRTFGGYKGNSTTAQGGEYIVKYPESVREIAKLIEKGKMPTLFFNPKDSGRPFTGKATEKLTHKGWEKLTQNSAGSTEEELTSELERYFNEKCRTRAGLELLLLAHGFGPVPTEFLYGRKYFLSEIYSYDDKERGCKHSLYGLRAPAVVRYLQECAASCIIYNKRTTYSKNGKKNSSFVVMFFNVPITFSCEEKQIAFYVANNRIHMADTDGTLWYDCYSGKSGRQL